jgi:superfamily II DNA or RNA helicase
MCHLWHEALMTSFNTFLNSFDADAGKRGKQFEHFVKWFLINDPQWSTQVIEVWLWDEWPQRWGPDCGIDLVFKHKDGQTWAVQSKCYDAKYNITKHDVDKFLSESNRAGIDKRLLIATTDGMGANAKQVCDAQDKEVVRYLLSNFEDADIEYPSSLADLNKAKPKPKPTPKPHQVEAIEAVTKGFADIDRGQLIMACGTGKTFTTLWIKEALNSESSLILLPSLGLLSQTLHEWTTAKNQDFAVLCVCSDDSVGKKGGDEAIHDIADLAFPVTSNSIEIATFLKQDGPKVVFSTYQSSNLIADAQVDQKVPSFDLAIADEAHRCAGDKAGNFATILDAQRIRAYKRLFTTATPRTYSTALKKGAEGRGIEIVGMDNEEVFGKRLYTLNFGQAIKEELLTDYRVVIVGVDSPMIASYIENREFVKTETGLEKDAETLAAQVALLKAMKDFDLHRMISFHSRVSRAEGFAGDLKEVAQWVDAKHRPSGELKTDFVSGEMPTFARRQKLAMLKNAEDNERALLTNARCLSEGVDVPSLDGVAFIDPKSSQVDIIQAVGRAIRLSPKKIAGTIVLPVFISSSDNPELALNKGNFKPIWDVLNALKSHDDVLADELDQMRVGMGKRGSSKVQGSFSKIEIYLPATVDKSFSDSIQTRLVESTTASWEYWYGLLLEYGKECGDYKVPLRHETKNKERLGAWVRGQRGSKDNMPISRKEKLEALDGWAWSANEWLPFVEAREFARTLGLKTASQWMKYSADGNLPDNIPSTPQNTYAENGWVSFGDWLGTGSVSVALRDYPPYEDVRGIVRTFNLKTAAQWKKFCRAGLKPLNIPSMPERTYEGSGWVGYGDWLGTDAKPRRDSSLWLAFEKARDYVRSLDLKSYENWMKYAKSPDFPDFLPADPLSFYTSSGWAGYQDFLHAPIEKRSFKEAKKLAQEVANELGIKSGSDWIKLGQEGRLPYDLPTRPERFYADEWLNWFDWFGRVNTRDKNYLSFEEARHFVRGLNLQTQKDWIAYLKSKLKPENIPYHPERVYKEKGWTGWRDWLQSDT